MITRRRRGSRERVYWQCGGGYDWNIEEPGTLRTIIDYVHLNPVRRGLVARATDWRWSSATGKWGHTTFRELSILVQRPACSAKIPSTARHQSTRNNRCRFMFRERYGLTPILLVAAAIPAKTRSKKCSHLEGDERRRGMNPVSCTRSA